MTVQENSLATLSRLTSAAEGVGVQAIALPAGGSAGGRLPDARRPRRVCAPILLCLRIVEPAQPLDGDISAVCAERFFGEDALKACKQAPDLVDNWKSLAVERRELRAELSLGEA